MTKHLHTVIGNKYTDAVEFVQEVEYVAPVAEVAYAGDIKLNTDQFR